MKQRHGFIHRLFDIVNAIQKVPGSIPSITLGIFLEVQGLERGPPSLVRKIGQLLDVRSSETRLRKLKLRLRDKRFANHKAIWKQPLQSVFTLRGCSAMDLLTACLVRRLAGLIVIQEVPSSIPGSSLEFFLEAQHLDRGSPSLVRTIWQLFDMIKDPQLYSLPYMHFISVQCDSFHLVLYITQFTDNSVVQYLLITNVNNTAI